MEGSGEKFVGGGTKGGKSVGEGDKGAGGDKGARAVGEGNSGRKVNKKKDESC